MQNTGIVVPCFNENHTIIKFIDELESVLANIKLNFELIVVDDASTDNSVALLQKKDIKAPNIKLHLIKASYNLGHQGAIYQGLCHAEFINCKQVIVMDGDGEDDPHAIPELLQKAQADIVHVKRGKRAENFVFRFFYGLYKLAFWLVTGKIMDFGNYCLINRRILETAVAKGFISFPAFLLKTKGEKDSIVLNRRKRIDGKSKMSLNGLIYHGFRSFSEFAEEFILFLLKIAVSLGILFLLSIVYVVYQKLFTDKAILGWASTLSATFFNAALISFGFFFIGIVLLNIYHKSHNSGKAKYEILK